MAPLLLDTSQLPATVTRALIGAGDSVTVKARRVNEFGISISDIANLIDNRLARRCLLPMPGIHRNRDGSLHRDQGDHTDSIDEWMQFASELSSSGWQVRVIPEHEMITTCLIVDDNSLIAFNYLNDPPGPLHFRKAQEVTHYVEQFEAYWRTSYSIHEHMYHPADFYSTCHLIVPDFEQITRELMAYFAEHPEKLQELEWRKFEELLDAIFRNQGYRTELGPGSGDGGVDLRLIQKDSIGTVITLVQARRYSLHNPIGLEAVQALHGVVDDQKAHRGLFVTTSRYLPGAQKFAERQNQRLILAASKEVANWCKAIAVL